MYIIKSVNGNIIKASDKPQIQNGDKVWFINLPFEDYKETPLFAEDIDENNNNVSINKQNYKMKKEFTAYIEIDKTEPLIDEEVNIIVDKSSNILITKKESGQKAIISIDTSKKIKFNEAGIYYIEALDKISNKIGVIVRDNKIITEIK